MLPAPARQPVTHFESTLLRTVVMNLLRRGGYRSIRQGFRELAYDIKGMLALGGVRLAQANSE